MSQYPPSKNRSRSFLRITLALCAFVLLLGFSHTADAKNALPRERIHDFHSKIHIHPDSSITVTETIRVTATGHKIRRGIYRDFPRFFRDKKGRRHTQAFDLVSVMKDGRPERHHSTGMTDYTRVYIGDKDQYIPAGDYTYQITYRVRAALLHFQEYDELYWNITGNHWDFYIEHAAAEIIIPGGAEILQHHSYTGRFGDTGQDYVARLSKNKLGVGTTRVLSPGEGLTVAVAWEPGYVVPPTRIDKLRIYWRANFWMALGGVLFVLLNVMYLTVWIRAGQDPEKGTIIPQFSPPENFSPVLAHHVTELGMDLDTAFAAAITSLAVKGFIKIEEREAKKHYRLRLLKDDLHDLPFSERYLIRKLFLAKNRKTLNITKKYDKDFSVAMKGFEERIKREYENVYFITNEKIFNIGAGFSGLYIGVALGLDTARPGIFALIVAFVIINLMYNFLLEAPTMRGRKMMDHLEGFRLYMKVAEKDRLNFLHPPEMTPELFEKFLPYAIALGVENKWTANFKKAVPKDVYNNYNPRWYSGSSNSFNPSTMSRSLSGGIGKAIGGASGSSGGGSSGGGGGGGGGGGW